VILAWFSAADRRELCQVPDAAGQQRYEDGFCDPVDFNDRLVLGLKDTMSKAESHILEARMYVGQLNKRRAGTSRKTSGGTLAVFWHQTWQADDDL
jgi:hypothetical protein